MFIKKKKYVITLYFKWFFIMINVFIFLFKKKKKKHLRIVIKWKLNKAYKRIIYLIFTSFFINMEIGDYEFTFGNLQ